MIRRVATVALVVALALFGALACHVLEPSILINILTTLVTVAGVVVTVFGIWVALIFPRLLTSYESGKAPSTVQEAARYRALVMALYRSCFVLCASGFVFVLVGLYGTANQFLTMSVAFFVWLSFFAICEAMWSAVVSGEVALVIGINRSRRSGLIRRLRRLGKTEKGTADQAATSRSNTS